jgi:hypothetical protein
MATACSIASLHTAFATLRAPELAHRPLSALPSSGNIVAVEPRTTTATSGDPIDAAASVNERELSDLVGEIAVPRHRLVQRRANRHIRDLVVSRLREDGYDVSLQGEFDNVVAIPHGIAGPWTLVRTTTACVV